jgi:hypothetical protein
MKELLDKYLQNGLSDFEGLEIKGHIPVKQELINALIADALKPKPQPDVASVPESDDVAEDYIPPIPAAPPTPKPEKSSGMDRKALTELVKGMVKRAEVKAVEGALVLEFELRR